MTETSTTSDQTSTAAETEVQENRPTLNLQDLQLVMQVIETSTERGTWKAGELSSVGSLYDRIVSFLVSAGALKPKEEEKQPAENQ